MDEVVVCKKCGQDFDLTDQNKKFFKSRGLDMPKTCQECRDEAKRSRFVRVDEIASFVATIEQAKSFRRDSNLIFRHMAEELGELARGMYQAELSGNAFLVSRELIDIIFLAVYMADVLMIDLNSDIPRRMQEISKKYLKEDL